MSKDLILLCNDKEDEVFANGLLSWLSNLEIAGVQKFEPDLVQEATVVVVLIPIIETEISSLIENLKIVNHHRKASIGVLMPETPKQNLTTISPYIDYLASETIYSNLTESLSKHLTQFFRIPPEVFIIHGRLPAYQKALSKSASRPLNETKLIIVGQGSVGKTSLVNRIVENKFDPDEEMTDGIAIRHWNVKVSNNQDLIIGNNGLSLPAANRDLRVTEDETIIVDSEVEIKVNIWDFGGQEIMHATHQFFLTKRCIYLLVVDARMSEEENRIEYWLRIIRSLGGGAPIILVGNKTDQKPLHIDQSKLKEKYPSIVGIVETSAASGKGVSDLILMIKQQMGQLSYIWDLLPESWFEVKLRLEELSRKKNFITEDEYITLCASHDIADEMSKNALVGFLHDLGVIVYFQDDPRLEALGILNPQWVTNGVYKILNSHILLRNNGVLTNSMLDEILNLSEYPRGKRLFIVDMMKKFELCYDLEPDKTFLVPDLLPKDKPKMEFKGVPAFEYVYPVLPSSIITRFIVRMNKKIHNGLVWHTGILLKIDENTALVKADIEDRKITIAIDGLEHTRRDALSAIRYQLDEIHGSTKGLGAQKRVPIPEAPNAEPLDYDYLLQLERDGDLEVLPVKDGNRLVKVNIRQLLSGIESEPKEKEISSNVTNIYISGNVEGSNIVSGNDNVVMQSIRNSFNKADTADIQTELKNTLKQLADAVAVMSKSLSDEQAAEVTDDLEKLVDEATKPKPNNRWYSVSIDGLIKAAENVEKVGKPVINLSQKVLSLLTGGVIS